MLGCSVVVEVEVSSSSCSISSSRAPVAHLRPCPSISLSTFSKLISMPLPSSSNGALILNKLGSFSFSRLLPPTLLGISSLVTIELESRSGGAGGTVSNKEVQLGGLGSIDLEYLLLGVGVCG